MANLKESKMSFNQIKKMVFQLDILNPWLRNIIFPR